MALLHTVEVAKITERPQELREGKVVLQADRLSLRAGDDHNHRGEKPLDVGPQLISRLHVDGCYPSLQCQTLISCNGKHQSIPTPFTQAVSNEMRLLRALSHQVVKAEVLAGGKGRQRL